MLLSGKTNLQGYQCSCNDKFPPAVLEAEINPTNGIIHLNNTKMMVRTKQLDCHDFIITHYMHKSLLAEKFPYIQVQFVTAQPLQADKQLVIGKTYNYNVTTVITLAGVARTHILPVQLTRLNKQYYKLTSSKELTMTEFNIKVRTPLNIVKAEDKVLIRFSILATTGI
ncbi:MAG: hypothetical protein QM725_05435 [Lacibacter sp.]